MRSVIATLLVLAALAFAFTAPHADAQQATVDVVKEPSRGGTTATSQKITTTTGRTGLSGNDSRTWGEVPISFQPSGGDPLIVVAPRFSASGATCTVAVGLYQSLPDGTKHYTGIAYVGTLTASQMDNGIGQSGYACKDGNYFAVASLGLGYDVRFFAVSTGTVDQVNFTVGAYARSGQ